MERTRDERLWTNVRFSLLLAFGLVATFVVLSKYIFTIPVVESTALIGYINESEQTFEQQEEVAKKLNVLQHNIDSLDFSIHQVQLLDEIKAEMTLLQEAYNKQNNSSKYIYSLHAFRAIKGYFDMKEALTSTIKNNQMIEKNLEECKANL